MGKRLRKQELLKEIQLERTALDDTLALLTPRQMTQAGVTRGGWSVKDILAHLVEWQQMNFDWYEAGLRGETPAMPAPGFTLRELPRLNEMIYHKHQHRSLQAVLRDYRSNHERMVALIATLPDDDLVRLERFSWTGPSWTLSDYLRASTAAHARARIAEGESVSVVGIDGMTLEVEPCPDKSVIPRQVSAVAPPDSELQ
jgi:hypothetical protein